MKPSQKAFFQMHSLKRSLGAAGETVLKLTIEKELIKSGVKVNNINYIQKSGQSQRTTDFSKFDLSVLDKDGNEIALIDVKTRTEDCWTYNGLGEYVFAYETIPLNLNKWKDFCKVKNNAFFVWISPNGKGVYFIYKPKKSKSNWEGEFEKSYGKDTRKTRSIDLVYFNVNKHPVRYSWKQLLAVLRRIA